MLPNNVFMVFIWFCLVEKDYSLASNHKPEVLQVCKKALEVNKLNRSKNFLILDDHTDINNSPLLNLF